MITIRKIGEKITWNIMWYKLVKLYKGALLMCMLLVCSGFLVIWPMDDVSWNCQKAALCGKCIKNVFPHCLYTLLIWQGISCETPWKWIFLVHSTLFLSECVAKWQMAFCSHSRAHLCSRSGVMAELGSLQSGAEKIQQVLWERGDFGHFWVGRERLKRWLVGCWHAHNRIFFKVMPPWIIFIWCRSSYLVPLGK